MLESAGIFLAAFLLFYFFFHSALSHSVLIALFWAIFNALTMYYMRVGRFKKSGPGR
jgi:multisubunit Na+/H+ antiporter MnhG subunit